MPGGVDPEIHLSGTRPSFSRLRQPQRRSRPTQMKLISAPFGDFLRQTESADHTTQMFCATPLSHTRHLSRRRGAPEVRLSRSWAPFFSPPRPQQARVACVLSIPFASFERFASNAHCALRSENARNGVDARVASCKNDRFGENKGRSNCASSMVRVQHLHPNLGGRGGNPSPQ
jgi:hypothetical protein